jgi:ectoine hydroxylase-related dioxygenase (phytanoyl-CoA dioxygenase family)
MSHLLSQADLVHFHEDGFLVRRSLYSKEEVRELGDAIDEIAARTPCPGKEMVYLEDNAHAAGDRILSRIEKFADYQPRLRDVACDPRILDPLAALLGDAPLLFKEKINFKRPGGGGFEPHQDIQPGWDDYAPYFVSVLITIDDSTLDNGCLELAAGQHRRGMLGERWKPLTAEQLRGVQFTPYPTAPGDAVFFDCFTPHRSAPNRTAHQRRNLYLTYNRRADGDHREEYFSDKRKSYPPDCERQAGVEYRFRV